VATQANGVQTELAARAASVNREVDSARQQIQAASKLQPQMEQMQSQLASAQRQIAQQQEVITSSQEFAKKIFSSHKQDFFDLKSGPHDRYITYDAGKAPDGTDVRILYLLLPTPPLYETIQLQFNQTPSAAGSFFVYGNVLIVLIQKDAFLSLTQKQISVAYFPDPSNKLLFKSLALKDGKPYADSAPLPFVLPGQPVPATPQPAAK